MTLEVEQAVLRKTTSDKKVQRGAGSRNGPGPRELMSDPSPQGPVADPPAAEVSTPASPCRSAHDPSDGGAAAQSRCDKRNRPDSSSWEGDAPISQ